MRSPLCSPLWPPRAGKAASRSPHVCLSIADASKTFQAKHNERHAEETRKETARAQRREKRQGKDRQQAERALIMDTLVQLEYIPADDTAINMGGLRDFLSAHGASAEILDARRNKATLMQAAAAVINSEQTLKPNPD